MASQPQPKVSYEEYLLLEQESESRHEYHRGEILEVEAASPNHEKICARLIGALLRIFPECDVYGSGLALYIESEDVGVYPDVTVICGAIDPVRVKGMPLASRNPFLLVEVQSPSTASYDRGSKWGYYSDIPSLQHILLVRQDRVSVDHFRRTSPRSWNAESYRDLENSIPLGDGQTLSLEEIYRRVEL